MKVLVLAGGFATRLHPFTKKRAKPLIPIKGKEIISHIVNVLPESFEIIVSTNKLFANSFKQWKKKFPKHKIKILVENSRSEKTKKGALGAIAFAIEKEKIKEDLMVFAGDNLFDFSMEDFLKAYNKFPMLVSCDVKSLDIAKNYGIITTKGIRVTGFQEKPKNPQSTFASTGCYIFPKKYLCDIVLFSKKNKDNLGTIFEYFLENNIPIHHFPHKGKWYDIGSFSSYIEAHRTFQKNDIILEKNVEILGKNNFKGAVFVGEKTKIKNSLIENSIVMDNVNIDNCSIINSIIDKKSILKNIKVINKIIEERSKIG